MERLSQELESLANDLEAYRDRLKEILISKKIQCANINTLGELIESVNQTSRSSVFSTKNTPMTNEEFNFADMTAFKLHTKTLITGYNNTAGFAIVGRNSSASGSANTSGDLRCEIKMDLTNVSQIKFHARKPANHGIVNVLVCTNGVVATNRNDTNAYPVTAWAHYNDINNTWKEYTMNVANITGVRIVAFIGGYTDSTGNTSSRTEYSNIRLI